MKLRFMLIPLAVLGLAVGSYADANKEEILKSTDKVLIKTKTKISEGSEKSEPKKKKSKWIDPTQKVCKANGGKMSSNSSFCIANWSNAKDICSASGGRLVTVDELKKIVTDCGGKINDYNKNQQDSLYTDCYKKKGFSDSSDYWSSSNFVGEEKKSAWFVGFYNGVVNRDTKDNGFYVRCVRDKQKIYDK